MNSASKDGFLNGDPEIIKAVMLGPSNAGKTALLTRYTKDEFSDTSTVTILCDYWTKRLSVRGKLVHLKLLDTAGQERFRSLSSAYYRLAHGIILVYDVTDRASFQAMDHWYNEVRTHAAPEAVICLVGSKTDMEASRQVSAQEGSDFALQHGLLFCEVSSKANQNVKTPFLEIVDKIISTPGFTAKGRQNESVQLYDKDPKESSKCAC